MDAIVLRQLSVWPVLWQVKGAPERAALNTPINRADGSRRRKTRKRTESHAPLTSIHRRIVEITKQAIYLNAQKLRGRSMTTQIFRMSAKPFNVVITVAVGLDFIVFDTRLQRISNESNPLTRRNLEDLHDGITHAFG